MPAKSEIRKAHRNKSIEHKRAFNDVSSSDQTAEDAVRKCNAANDVLKDDIACNFYMKVYKEYDTDNKGDEQYAYTQKAYNKTEAEEEEDYYVGLSANKKRNFDSYITRLAELRALGFDSAIYARLNPDYDRSFLGQKFKGSLILDTLSMAGFVYYALRGILVQKTANIILLLCGGAGGGVTFEFLFLAAAIAVYIHLYRKFRADGDIPSVQFLAKYRIWMLPVEFVMLAVTLGMSDTAGCSTTILVIVGLQNFWACIVLLRANMTANEASDAEEAVDAMRELVSDLPDDMSVSKNITDLYFLLDSTLNGVLNRVAINLSVWLAIAVVAIAASVDVCHMCGKKEEDDEVMACVTIVWVAVLIHWISHQVAQCSFDRKNNVDDAQEESASRNNARSVARLYLLLELMHSFKQMAWAGEMWLLRKRTYDGCMWLWTRVSTCTREAAPAQPKSDNADAEESDEEIHFSNSSAEPDTDTKSDVPRPAAETETETKKTGRSTPVDDLD
mgnify:CR=1 FL=1